MRNDIGAAVGEASDWLWGMLQGDFNENQSASQALVGGLVSMVPGIDQLMDLRDVIANVRKLTDDGEDAVAWMALVITLIGLIPVLGSALKTVIKVARATKRLEDVLSVLRPLSKGDPIAWLKQLDWNQLTRQVLAQFDQVCKQLIEFIHALRDRWIARKMLGKDSMEKLNMLEAEIIRLQSKGLRAIPEAMKAIKAELDELITGAKRIQEKTQASVESGKHNYVRNSFRPLQRLEYETKIRQLEGKGQAMLKAGKSEAEVAKTLHNERRAIGQEFKDRTDPELREVIYGRNKIMYGDELGPSYEKLKAGKRHPNTGRWLTEPKTDKQILQSASRPGGDDFNWNLILERQKAMDAGEVRRAKQLLDQIAKEMKE